MPTYKKSADAVSALLKRFKVAKQHRTSWEQHWKECYEYALPQREVFNTHAEGAKKNTKIYDSTALIATQRFASRLQSTLVPPFKKWAKLSAVSNVHKEFEHRINRGLEEMTDILFGYINQSNLATEAHEAFLDLAVGTGALLLDEGEGDDLLKFTAVPLKELLVEDGPHGTIETVFRIHEHPARNIKQIWKKGKCSTQVMELVENKPDELVSIIEATVYNPDKKIYEYVIIEEATQHVIFEDYFEISPWIVFRWSKVAGERFGRGPIMTALPDIKTANEVVKYVLKNAEKEIIGVYTAVDDGVLNPWTVNVESGAIIPVAAEGSLAPLQSGGNFNVSELVLKDLRENIKKALFHDQLGPIEGPTKSATEVSIRQQELMSDIGSSFGRLQMEFINKLIRRAIDILQRNGKINPIKIRNQKIEVKVISPLAQQQDMDEVNKIAQFIQFAMMVGEDAVKVGLDLEAFPEHIAKLLGVDLDLVRSKNEREALKQQMQEEAAVAQAAEVAVKSPELAQQAMEQMGG